MEFSIRNLPFKADQWEVTTAIAEVLHRCPGHFVTGEQERKPNFKVELNASLAGGVQNNGTGTFILPKLLGRKFQRLTINDEIVVEVRGKKLRFSPTRNSVWKEVVNELEKAPFVDPDIARDRTRRINTLRDPFYLSCVQIGTFYSPEDAHPKDPRSFSIEWERDLSRRSMGLLFFEYEYKCIRIRIGDQNQEKTFHNLIVPFSSINKMAMGRDFGNPYICFDLYMPPLVQEEEIHQPDLPKGFKYRRRVGSVNAGHETIAPYAHQLRIVLYDSSDSDYGFDDVLKRFYYYCQTSLMKLPKEVTIQANGRQNFFLGKKLNAIGIWLRSKVFSAHWRVAFQIEAILHNGVANTTELMELRPQIEGLIHSFPDTAGDIMRRFVDNAAHRPLGRGILEYFEGALKQKARRSRTSLTKGRFFCHHVSFTPSRMLLEGPTITQSNRVIREYEGYEDNFIRVNFCEEDRLRYKWNRDVDTVSHLEDRVGTLLKGGFDLAGKRFEFLAYSQSALKEHAVWYVSAFDHPTKGLVTAQSIRDSLGDFSGVIYSPSKYGARMAQAFSGTDPSIRIRNDQWSLIPDIEEHGVNFTDGVGTISQKLAGLIWEVLCANNPSLAVHSIVPSAYQIRFLGCKGVVSVDSRLEGIHMCVRPSMKKFDVPWEDFGTIEIADTFGRPRISYLNRPLVMLLEDRGAPKEVFLQLQREIVANTRMTHDSADLFAKLLESNKLCFNFRLAAILTRLKALDLELKPSRFQQPLDTPFFARLRTCAINHVLRAVRYEARIQIPNSFMLAGVADEGPAYVQKGLNNVYCLPQGKIFACVQYPEDEKPRYLQGMCLVFRNPVIHPGDVQRVYAIGPPPGDQICLFGKLKNVIVFSSTGSWSLPNGLGGGDLDGDQYTIIQHGDLLVTEHHDPASYPPVDPFKRDRPSTIDDVCDFIVEYINSDVLGLVSIKHRTIADQSKDGTLDPACLKLAEMHSRAVDYQKNGLKVDTSEMPRNLIQFKPDWLKTDEDINAPSDYYESQRALGLLYRDFSFDDIPDSIPQPQDNPGQHPISKVLYKLIRPHLPHPSAGGQTPAWINTLFTTYSEELTYIASIFSLSKVAGARLHEEELVIGTILAKCPQKGYRDSRMHEMRENVGSLVHDVKEQLVGRMETLSELGLKEKLGVAWRVWEFSLGKTRLSPIEFGSESFGLIGLGLVLELLERLGSLPPLGNAGSRVMDSESQL